MSATETFSPVRGMIYCINGTGQYVRVEDYTALSLQLETVKGELANAINQCRTAEALAAQHQETIDAQAKELDALTRGARKVTEAANGIMPKAREYFLIRMGHSFNAGDMVNLERIIESALKGKGSPT